MADSDLAAFHLWWIDAFGDHSHIGVAAATRWFLDPLELGPNDIILDVGCFVGGALRLAARRYRCEGIGVDPEPRFLEIARTKAAQEGLSGQLRFQEGVASDTRLAESSVHVVLSLDSPFDAAEAWRVLKANGSFCVATRSEETIEAFSSRLEEQGFRTERAVDATQEAIRVLRNIHERFKDEERPQEYLSTVDELLQGYQQGKTYYLRWVGRRR